VLLSIAILIFALALIVLSSELFTNGIEWLGQRLSLGEGVIGSIFAAAGTALPETLIPFVAIIFFGPRHGADVGIGAIAGAPFMLSTLTFAICGLSIIIFARSGRRSPALQVNSALIAHDLHFFLIAYALALLGTFLSPFPMARWFLALFIFAIYPYYVYQTVKREQEMGSKPEHLHFDRILRLGKPDRLTLIIPQVVAGVSGILAGAWMFVDHVESVARNAGLQPLILSLVICPIATELPEKINSILWARNGKDTLALANISGALVFQSCIPVAFGVAFTTWQLGISTIATGVVALSCAFVYKLLLDKNKLTTRHLIVGGIAYVIVVATLIGFDIIDTSPISFNGLPIQLVGLVRG
jgi:cation:H+ antiporter